MRTRIAKGLCMRVVDVDGGYMVHEATLHIQFLIPLDLLRKGAANSFGINLGYFSGVVSTIMLRLRTRFGPVFFSQVLPPIAEIEY